MTQTKNLRTCKTILRLRKKAMARKRRRQESMKWSVHQQKLLVHQRKHAASIQALQLKNDNRQQNETIQRPMMIQDVPKNMNVVIQGPMLSTPFAMTLHRTTLVSTLFEKMNELLKDIPNIHVGTYDGFYAYERVFTLMDQNNTELYPHYTLLHFNTMENYYVNIVEKQPSIGLDSRGPFVVFANTDKKIYIDEERASFQRHQLPKKPLFKTIKKCNGIRRLSFEMPKCVSRVCECGVFEEGLNEAGKQCRGWSDDKSGKVCLKCGLTHTCPMQEMYGRLDDDGNVLKSSIHWSSREQMMKWSQELSPQEWSMIRRHPSMVTRMGATMFRKRQKLKEIVDRLCGMHSIFPEIVHMTTTTIVMAYSNRLIRNFQKRKLKPHPGSEVTPYTMQEVQSMLNVDSSMAMAISGKVREHNSEDVSYNLAIEKLTKVLKDQPDMLQTPIEEWKFEWKFGIMSKEHILEHLRRAQVFVDRGEAFINSVADRLLQLNAFVGSKRASTISKESDKSWSVTLHYELNLLVREACKAGNRMRFSTEDVQRLVVAPKTYNRRSGNDLKFHQVLHNVAGAALFMGYYMVSESDNLSKPFQKPYTEILKIILERSTSDWEAYKDEKASRSPSLKTMEKIWHMLCNDVIVPGVEGWMKPHNIKVPNLSSIMQEMNQANLYSSGFIPVSVTLLDKKKLGIDVGRYDFSGSQFVQVQNIELGGYAHKRGLQHQDILMSINGTDLKDKTTKEFVNTFREATTPIQINIARFKC